jgi:hypothetical protein
MLSVGLHIHLYHYVFHCTAIEYDSLLSVHPRIGSPVCRFFQLCVCGWPWYYYLFLPTQFDRVVLPAYRCSPMFHIVFELLFLHPFHQVLRWVRFLVTDLFIQSVFRCLVCRLKVYLTEMFI